MFDSLSNFLNKSSNAISGGYDFAKQSINTGFETAGGKVKNLTQALGSREKFAKYLTDNADKGNAKQVMNISSVQAQSQPQHVEAPNAASLLAELQNMG